MDITMPEMDGLKALKEIIAINPKAKVNGLGHGPGGDGARSDFKRREGFIVKPFKEEGILPQSTACLIFPRYTTEERKG